MRPLRRVITSNNEVRLNVRGDILRVAIPNSLLAAARILVQILVAIGLSLSLSRQRESTARYKYQIYIIYLGKDHLHARARAVRVFLRARIKRRHKAAGFVSIIAGDLKWVGAVPSSHSLLLFLSPSFTLRQLSGQTGIVTPAPSGRNNRTYDTHIRAHARMPKLSGRALAENNVQFRRNCTYDPDPPRSTLSVRSDVPRNVRGWVFRGIVRLIPETTRREGEETSTFLSLHLFSKLYATRVIADYYLYRDRLLFLSFFISFFI